MSGRKETKVLTMADPDSKAKIIHLNIMEKEGNWEVTWLESFILEQDMFCVGLPN